MPAPLRLLLDIVAGVLAGAGCTALAYYAGSAFGRVGHQSTQEFAVSQGSAWFYLAILIVTGIALVVLFLPAIGRKLQRDVRIIGLSALFVMLGGMSLCNLFSGSYLLK